MTIIGSSSGAVPITGKNNTSVAFGGAAGGYWYEWTDDTNPTYFFSRTGTEDWRWGIRIDNLPDGSGAGNTLNKMDVQWKIKTGTPTMHIIGRLWDDSEPANIVETLNFESSGSGTYLTGSDITSSYEWYTATIETPTVMTDNHVVGIEAITAGTSPATNYMSMAYNNEAADNPSYYNGWNSTSDPTVQNWSNSPYRMNQRLY
tara:strand:- start:141 stop:749 length:609 start_codon:yes stop_codon:yes gene_type:complete